MAHRRALDYEDDDDEDAEELSGWGNTDFDAVTIAAVSNARIGGDPTKQQQQSPPTKFAVADARKREQRWRRKEKEKAQELEQDVVELFRNNLFDDTRDNTLRRSKLSGAQVSPARHMSTTTHDRNSDNSNISSKSALLLREFAVSGCVVSTPNLIRVTKVRSPAKHKQHHQLTQQQQHTQQQLANLNPAQVPCKIVGLIDDHKDDAYAQQPWRPTPLAVRKSDRNARFPLLLNSSHSVDALLSQHFRSDLEEKVRALPVPFGAHLIDQSLRKVNATAVRTSLLPPLVDANGSNKVQEHISSMRRLNGRRKTTGHQRNQ